MVGVLALKHLVRALWLGCVETFFLICSVLSLGCVMWLERNIYEHDKLVFRGIMVETEVIYHKKKWYLYVTSICIKSVAHSARFYQL